MLTVSRSLGGGQMWELMEMTRRLVLVALELVHQPRTPRARTLPQHLLLPVLH